MTNQCKAEYPHTPFTCAHALTGIGATAEWNQCAVTEKVLPYCSDFAVIHKTILVELTEWEQLVRSRAFGAASKQ
jgi:hypothetical protein